VIVDAVIEARIDPVTLPEPTVQAAGLLPGERTEPPSRAARSATVTDAAALPSRWRAFGRCVAARESHGNPRARNPRSSAQGTYQFLDRSWRRGLAHMVTERLRAHGMPRAEARALRAWLRGHEIATWPARLQDVGFAAVVTAGGAFHWSLAGSTCEAYR
jgi:hypothetical protein